MLGFFKITDKAIAPQRSYCQDAGFDLFSAYEEIVPAQSRKLIRTDIGLKLPRGCYGRIAPRSGLALFHSIDVGGGVLDPNYRGNICVLLINHSNVNFLVQRGDRIAQLICEKVFFPKLYEMRFNETCGEDSNNPRGSKGFGSSGV